MPKRETESTDAFSEFLTFVFTCQPTIENMRKALMMFLEHEGYRAILHQDGAKEHLFDSPLRYLRDHPDRIKLPKNCDAAKHYFMMFVASLRYPEDATSQQRQHATAFLGALSQAI